MSDDKVKLEIDRLVEAEEALRKISPIDGALGQNNSDYHNMWQLFTQIVDRASSMSADPRVFMKGKSFDTSLLNAWTKMLATAKSILEGLNRMRNNDKTVARMLDIHARYLTQAVCIDLGVEIKGVIKDLDDGVPKDEIVIRLKRLLNRRIPEIFDKSAGNTLISAKEEFGLI